MPQLVQLKGSGVEIWFGGPDTPVPPDPPATTADPLFTVGVSGSGPTDQVLVRYRTDGKDSQVRLSRPLKTKSLDGRVVTQYSGEIVGLRPGSEVSYSIVFERLTPKGVQRLPAEVDPRRYPYRFVLAAKGARPPAVVPPAVAPEPPAAPRVSPPFPCEVPVAGGDCTVQGTVVSPDRPGVGGLRVQIVDKNVGPDVSLAETRTDRVGAYQVTFSTASLLERHKARPDLQARVFADETYLGASGVRYNATAREVLNVLLPPNIASLMSEYETLIGALACHFGGNLRDLQESDDRQDVTYLANKAGWDARAVALAALADQFSQGGAAGSTPTIKPALYYALFRAGLPANPETLYHAPKDTVAQVWNQAIEQGVIPQATEQEINDSLDAFQRLSANTLLAALPMVGVSSLKQMLTVSHLDESQQTRLSEIYAAHREDLPTFWSTIATELGATVATRLQVDGKLGFLTLNNAPLVQRMQTIGGGTGLADPLQLAQAGYHAAAKWLPLLDGDVTVPADIPGDTPETMKANYAEYLAAQIRLSYPTATVAEMVKSGTLPVAAPVANLAAQVHTFLTDHQGKFEIGLQPIQQYANRNKLALSAETLAEVKRLQRIYQITPTDEAMAGLARRGLDAAYHVVRHDRQSFVERFAPDLGGADSAVQVYDKAVQVHNTVLNIAVSFLTARNGIPLGAPPLNTTALMAEGAAQVLLPAPTDPSPANASDVIAYPTLESLFGSMDFCACDECRSILSPAAYLVDLLHFVDRGPASTDKPGKENAQTVLLERRPDLQHLPLTCENTNTALPYIDVVNETLEYFIANDTQKLSLNGYAGHDTDGLASEDLLASPQFVMDAAYTLLRAERFPISLPFHQPLESLRRHFNKFEVPLPLAMERLRKTDDLDRGSNAYGWRDILMEEIALSRSEYEILTDSTVVPLRQMYGFPDGTTDEAIIAALSNAENFSRRVGISYEDLAAILRTRFINPGSDLIPKLERLGVGLSTLAELKTKNDSATDAGFDSMLPTGAGAPDPAAYGGDIKKWVKNDANYARIISLITLTGPATASEGCSFDDVELRYARPIASLTDTSTRLGTADFVRLLRFIRLWKKLGWEIENMDAAICALYRTDLAPLTAEDLSSLGGLDTGFLNLLPRLGIAIRVMAALRLKPKSDLLGLLACWSNIGTHGAPALYGQMFLNGARATQDPAFADNGYGEFLTSSAEKLMSHAEALRSAFNLTADDFERIAAALGFDASTPLTSDNIASVFRRGWLARKLRLSVRELLLFIKLTGLDPFAAPDPTNPAILRLIDFVQALRARSFKSAVALYLIWNQDLSGKSATDPAQVTEFARTLRGDFAGIEDQFAATEDPGGDIARARMALVYGQEATDAFFALLDGTITVDIAYTQSAPVLEATIIAVDSRIAYDGFRHRLSYSGVLNAPTRDALKGTAGVTTTFQSAVDGLFAKSKDAKDSFLSRFPELTPLYEAFVSSTDPAAAKRSALLSAFRPELSRRRKRQQALQRLSAAANTDLSFAQMFLDPLAIPYPLHSAGEADKPALDDVMAVETPGLAAQFFYRDTATGVVDLAVPAAPNLDYASGSDNRLPSNATAGASISGIWTGEIETPESAFFNFVVEADARASVALTLDGTKQPMTQNGSVWRNRDALEFEAGALIDVALTVENVTDALRVSWETSKRAREVIPARYLYPPTILAPFVDAYGRFMKVASLALVAGLTAAELVLLATDPDNLVAGDAWLNALPVRGDPASPIAVALLRPFKALLDFVRIKADISPGDESLLTVFSDPVKATETPDSLLFRLTRWDKASLDDVLANFGGDLAGLARFDPFRRVYDALSLTVKMGLSGAALIRATTNEPTGDLVRDFQGALRARYAPSDWRDVVQPINDAMRGLQRDALVAYVLHKMRSNPSTAEIDTADKLFEYFLMDVQMEPCMQTSRIRHALSSVQLFVERCLMNLEPRVSPTSISAPHWEWMKRYRVWEANRKVFLFPENWLEPELRDDKSPFFKEIESQLLQSDISDDSATTALLTYLSRLEEVAKLEPCGIYYAENQAGAEDDVAHVIARTAGAHRKYYYRRYETGYWTPWEQIKLDIEDNPVIPVLWKGRLLLFWLRLIKGNAPAQTSKPSSTLSFGGSAAKRIAVMQRSIEAIDETGATLPGVTADQVSQEDPGPPAAASSPQVLANATLSDVRTATRKGAARVSVGAVLCWSEYYNGKWQPTKTSSVDQPAGLGVYDPQNGESLDRSAIRLSVAASDGELRLRIDSAFGSAGFLLYNTHSLPTQTWTYPDPPASRDFDAATGPLWVSYAGTAAPVSPGKRPILTNALPGSTVQPGHPIGDLWRSPFLYEDSRHVFYVSSSEQPVTIPEYNDVGIVRNTPAAVAEIPSLLRAVPPGAATLLPRRMPSAPAFNVGEADPKPIERLVATDANIRTALGTTGRVSYGGRDISVSGSAPSTTIRAK